MIRCRERDHSLGTRTDAESGNHISRNQSGGIPQKGSKMPAMIHVPTTVEEFRPPNPTDLITEAASFLRVHWEEVREDFQRISGEAPSKHDSLRFDEAECAFKIKSIASANGFAVLGSVSTDKLWKAMRRGYKRNTGFAVRELEKQNKTLRLEQRRDAR